MTISKSVYINAAIGGMVALFSQRHKNRAVHVVDEFPPLHSLKRTYLGAFVWTGQSDRWISKAHANDVQSFIMSPADIAREYLTFRYGLQKRRTSTKTYRECFCPKHKAAPIYANPQQGEFVYVDLKAAYWNIVLRGGWDVDYGRDRFIGVGSNNWDFPFPTNKLARNILVSSGLPRTVQVWTGKQIITIKGKNPLYNGILWCFVQDVLHDIAQDMIEHGAVYVHTDGYIFPYKKVHHAFDIAKSWGFDLGVKYSGYGEVFGAANYWIEGKRSKRPRPSQFRVVNNIEPTTRRDWLRENLKMLEYRKHTPDQW